MLRRSHFPSICHSEHARNPLCKIMCDGCTDTACRNGITHRGMLRCALHDSAARKFFVLHCMTARRRECFAVRTSPASVIPSLRGIPCARSCPMDVQTLHAATRSRPGGCFAALCMTARRRECFAVHHPSISHSEPARNPLCKILPDGCTDTACRNAITPRGCFAALCMTAQQREFFVLHCMIARRRECFAVRTSPASVIPSMRGIPCARSCAMDAQTLHAATGSRIGGCFAALCMTAWRGERFAVRTQHSIVHSEPAICHYGHR